MSGAANSRIDVTFPTGTTFGGYVSATVRNLTTATNVGSCANPSGLRRSSARSSRQARSPPATTSRSPSTASPTRPRRPPTSGRPSRRRQTRSRSTPRRSRSSPPSPISAVTVDNTNPSRAAGARTQYVVGFTTSATGGGMSGAANSRIDVTFPTGTTFAGYVSATVRDLTTATDVGSCANPSRPRDPVLALLVEHDRRRPQRRDHLQRHHQPAHGGRRQAATVSTTSDPQPVDSAQFTVVAASPITAVTVDNTNPSRPPAPARSTSSASPPRPPAAACPAPPTAASTSPSPPAPPSPATSAPPCATSRTATNVGSCCNPVGLVIQCSLFSSNTIGAGHNIAITFNGITNPPFQGTDNRARVSTTSDTADRRLRPVRRPRRPVAHRGHGRAREHDRVGDHAVRRALRHLGLRRPLAAPPTAGSRSRSPRGDVRRLHERDGPRRDGERQRRQLREPQRTGHPVLDRSPATAIAPGHAVRVTFTNITNPAAPGSYSVRAATTSDLPPITSSPYQVGGDTSAPETTIESRLDAVHASPSSEPGSHVRVLDRRWRHSRPARRRSRRRRCAPRRAHVRACAPSTPPATPTRRPRRRSVRRSAAAADPDADPDRRRRPRRRRPTPEPTPQFNQTVVVEPAGGTVQVCPKGGQCFTLAAGQTIPMGSTVDTKKGAVELTSLARPARRRRRPCSPRASSGSRQRGDITELKLTEPLAPCSKRARAAAKKPKSRKLWGTGKGKFRTVGNYSAATVRGTRWLVQDTCAGTLDARHRGRRVRARQRQAQDRDRPRREEATPLGRAASAAVAPRPPAARRPRSARSTTRPTAR